MVVIEFLLVLEGEGCHWSPVVCP
uniref:Uncharacterized protein n=1 Tax=Rhizophora mucronata TaxID=61149 RepID=A0A2P2R1B2_RHIMU